MKNSKIAVSIDKKPHLFRTGDLVENAGYIEFLNHSGGRLAVGLFNGDMRTELVHIIDMAMTRGMLEYHNKLMEQAKQEALDKRKKQRKVRA